MPELLFATNNQHKADEMQAAMGTFFTITTLKQAGLDIEIPEPHDTLEANAVEKSKTIFLLTGKNCFSEDTGLEVDALGGAPGVRSARYAAEEPKFANNIDKLLYVLGNNINRNARFRTVISLQLNHQSYLFDGSCTGTIGHVPKGINGFGYDPVFIPSGSDKTFGEMTMEEKSRFSHRKKACDKLVSFLHHAGINL